MRYRLIFLVIWLGLLSCFAMATAHAEEKSAGSSGAGSHSSISSNPEDPGNMLNGIQERRTQRESLLPVSPLKWLHDGTGKMWDAIYQATHIKMGLTLNHLFQGASDVLPEKDDWGTTTDADFAGTWELLNRGEPTRGKLYFHIEGRWDYGTTGPQTIGFDSLATAGGTANAFSRYDPTFLLRNLYWEQGSQKAGWAYRIGKITTDSILATSRHISPVTTFLPNAGTGLFVSGYADSGLGMVGVWYPSDRYRILGLVSDANGNRYDWGDISAGDFYKALELGIKLFPKTEKAGYSKFTVWHNDGTEDGQPINASTGKEGWGITLKLEQELSDDGQTVGVFRWGKSWDKAAIYDQQAGVHLLFYDPFSTTGLKNDVIGFASNWVDSAAEGTRDEYNLEVFYRFPLFPGLDTRLSYQYVIDPAFTREIDSASVFSLGFRTVF
jgi:porin